MMRQAEPVDDHRAHGDLTARLVADVEDYAILLLDPAGNVATWMPGRGG